MVQGSPATLLATAADLADARIKLEALQAGTDGVLLRTDDPAEVCGSAASGGQVGGRVRGRVSLTGREVSWVPPWQA